MGSINDCFLQDSRYKKDSHPFTYGLCLRVTRWESVKSNLLLQSQQILNSNILIFSLSFAFQPLLVNSYTQLTSYNSCSLFPSSPSPVTYHLDSSLRPSPPVNLIYTTFTFTSPLRQLIHQHLPPTSPPPRSSSSTLFHFPPAPFSPSTRPYSLPSGASFITRVICFCVALPTLLLLQLTGTYH